MLFECMSMSKNDNAICKFWPQVEQRSSVDVIADVDQ